MLRYAFLTLTFIIRLPDLIQIIKKLFINCCNPPVSLLHMTLLYNHYIYHQHHHYHNYRYVITALAKSGVSQNFLV